MLRNSYPFVLLVCREGVIDLGRKIETKLLFDDDHLSVSGARFVLLVSLRFSNSPWFVSTVELTIVRDVLENAGLGYVFQLRVFRSLRMTNRRRS